jgi:nicotinamidase-related amidase
MPRALLAIDVQNEYFTGALPITHPHGHLSRVLETVDAAAAAGTPVVAVRHHQPDPASPLFRKGSPAWELHPELARRPHDLLLDKALPGCFTNTVLDDWLRERGIDTIAIAGYMTHICCDTTARQAMHRGYKVEFLSDATGTLALDNPAGKVTAEELHRAILCAQQMFISEVLPTSAWRARL